MMKNNRFPVVVLALSPFFLVLGGCSQFGEPTVEGRWYTQSQVEQGNEIFLKNCARCHGEDASGKTNDWREARQGGQYDPPPINGSAKEWLPPLRRMRYALDHGGKNMPSFKNVLNEQEKEAAMAYVQSLWPDEAYQEWEQRGGLLERKSKLFP